MAKRVVDTGFHQLKDIGWDRVAIREYIPSPVERGEWETKIELPFTTLRELVRRYELLADYTPDPDVVLVEDAG